MVLPDNFFDVEFGKAMAFGYKTEDVDEFVTRAIETIKAQQEEIEVLQDKLGVLAASLEKYREEEDSLRSALIGAQKLGDSILKDSKSKAEVILRDATVQANHIIEEAHVRLEREKAEYAAVKAEVSGFREKLIAMYKTHIDQIAKIPYQPKARDAAEETPEEAVPPVQAQEPREEAPAAQAPRTRAAEAPRPEEPAAVREAPAPRGRPAIQLELVETEEEEESPVVASFSSRVDRIIAQPAAQPQVLYSDEDFEDEEEAVPAGHRPVISSKFGVLKFGDGFDLQEEDGSRPRPRK